MWTQISAWGIVFLYDVILTCDNVSGKRLHACCLLLGRVVVSLTYLSFPFSILCMPDFFMVLIICLCCGHNLLSFVHKNCKWVKGLPVWYHWWKISNFEISKDTFGFVNVNYIDILEFRDIYNLFKFRTTNHRLRIKIGRWKNIRRERWTCKLCNSNVLGDEFHYIMKNKEMSVKETHLLMKNM